MARAPLHRRSAAFKALALIVELGGRAPIARVQVELGREYMSRYHFDWKITDVLRDYGYATLTDGVLIATAAGKDTAGAAVPAVTIDAYVGQVALPKVAMSRGILDLTKIAPATVVREGAFDHLQIPSLMGGSTVVINGKAVVVGEQRVLPRDRTSA